MLFARKQSMHLVSVLILIGVHCPSLSMVAGENETASCFTTPVVLGETAYVICDFPVDVSSVRPVIISVETNLTMASTEVLECQWLAEGEAHCSTAEGYTSSGPEGSRLTLVVTKMAEQHAGQYVCKMMTPRFLLGDIEPCVLELRPAIVQSGTDKESEEVTNAANNTMVPASDNKTDIHEESGHKGHKDTNSHKAVGPLKTETIVVVSVVIVSALLISLIVAVCLKMRYQQIKSRGPAGPETSTRGFWRSRLKFFMNLHSSKDKERRVAGLESGHKDLQRFPEESGVIDICHVQVASSERWSDTIHAEAEQSLLDQQVPGDEDEEEEDKEEEKPSISDFNEQIKAAAAGMSLKLKQRQMSESES